MSNQHLRRSPRYRLAWASIVLTLPAALLGACAESPSDTTMTPTLTPSGEPSPASGAPSLVVFGDSWGYGAHCGGCSPWPRLLPADYKSSLGIDVTLTDLTENGGDSASLVDELKHNSEYRAAVTEADIVVVNMGMNDLEQTADPGELTKLWSTNLDAMLDIVDKLRQGRPTAVRMVGVSNEYLTDPGLRIGLGDSASKIFESFNKVSCTTAAAHGGQCVDLRPVLNGPDRLEPADPNTQESMDAVATAIAAVGLTELGVT